MFLLPFLNPYHFYPLTNFYTEWLALAIGLAALAPLSVKAFLGGGGNTDAGIVAACVCRPAAGAAGLGRHRLSGDVAAGRALRGLGGMADLAGAGAGEILRHGTVGALARRDAGARRFAQRRRRGDPVLQYRFPVQFHGRQPGRSSARSLWQFRAKQPFRRLCHARADFGALPAHQRAADTAYDCGLRRNFSLRAVAVGLTHHLALSCCGAGAQPLVSCPNRCAPAAARRADPGRTVAAVRAGAIRDGPLRSGDPARTLECRLTRR